jgi:O-antigen/teichoic acid export membrane protein
MSSNIFEITPNALNLFSFMLGMTFASFLSWYKRTAFMYVVGYFMGLAFYYGAIKPVNNVINTPKQSYSAPSYNPADDQITVNPRTHLINPRQNPTQ